MSVSGGGSYITPSDYKTEYDCVHCLTEAAYYSITPNITPKMWLSLSTTPAHHSSTDAQLAKA